MTLREIRPDDGSPSCHVCGAIMVRAEKGFKCLSCGVTTEPTGPAPSVVESRKWTDQDLYEAYLHGCEDDCLPEPLDKGTFLAAWEDTESVQ